MINPHRPTLIFLTALITFLSGCSSQTSLSTTNEVWTGDDLESRSTFDNTSQFIIYLHGKIVEDEGVDAVHPEHGQYEYFETLTFLASSGSQLISEVRQPGTNGIQYAEIVLGWVHRLLDAGVPPKNISIVGFSKGAGIAIYVSDMVENSMINFVLIAICGDWIDTNSDIKLNGRVLSLFEESDEFGGSCSDLVERSPGISDFEEISYSTGDSHGAFYQAESFWLDDVMDWVNVE
jgi:hypothetical protein